MWKAHSVRLVPLPSQVEKMELMITMEMVFHDLLVRNAREAFMETGKVPEMGRWVSFLDSLREENEKFGEMDRECFMRMARDIHLAVSDAVKYGDPDEPLESFPPYWDVDDRFRVPLHIGTPGEVVFGEHTVCVPGIGDISFLGEDRPCSETFLMDIKFRDYTWILEWRDWKKERPLGLIYEAYRDGEGKTGFRTMRFPGLEKEEEPDPELLTVRDGYILSDCE